MLHVKPFKYPLKILFLWQSKFPGFLVTDLHTKNLSYCAKVLRVKGLKQLLKIVISTSCPIINISLTYNITIMILSPRHILTCILICLHNDMQLFSCNHDLPWMNWSSCTTALEPSLGHTYVFQHVDHVVFIFYFKTLRLNHVISYSKSPWRKIVFTCNCLCSRCKLAAKTFYHTSSFELHHFSSVWKSIFSSFPYCL